MAVKIGVRDLKNRALEIVRDVHEQDAQYIVTLRGEPVAVLRSCRRIGEIERFRGCSAICDEPLAPPRPYRSAAALALASSLFNEPEGQETSNFQARVQKSR